MKELWRYNKKEIIIGIILIVIIVIIGISVFNKKEENITIEPEVEEKIEKLVLFGSKEITLTEGDKYVEPGYYAITSNNEIKKEEIEVTPKEIDTSVAGTYQISYTIKDKIETRKIIVLEKEKEEIELEEGTVELSLKGESTVVLNVGDEYVEAGYKAYDTKNRDISEEVIVKGMVNTGEVGEYTITYEIELSGKKISKTRKVIVTNNVIDAEISGNPTSETNKNVMLRIEVKGNNFYYLKYPDGTVSKNKVSTYEVEKNGTYKFLIYDTNNNYIVKSIVVDKINKVKPSGTCSAVVTNGKTTITTNIVNNGSTIKNYVFYGNGKQLKNQTSNIYTYSGVLTTASVLVYDTLSNSTNITCSVKNENVVESKYDYLELHMIVSGHYDDAILIRTAKATILIDGGRKACYKKVSSYLNDLGVKTIDAVIGSHTDYDHIDAQGDIIRNYKVLNAYYPVNLSTCYSQGYCDESTDGQEVLKASKEKNLSLQVKKAGEKLTIGDMTLYFIGPPGYKYTGSYRGNANSFIFILKYKNTTFMFPGDADGGTFNLSKNKPYADKLGISLDIDVLKYPHHGNAGIETSLLNAMSPKYVLIPNYNAKQFPTSSNKSKITNIGAKIYQNAYDGNIVLKSDGNNISVKTNQSASTYKR